MAAPKGIEIHIGVPPVVVKVPTDQLRRWLDWFRLTSPRIGLEEQLKQLRLAIGSHEEIHIKISAYTLQNTLISLVHVFELLIERDKLPQKIKVSILRPDLSQRPLSLWNIKNPIHHAYWQEVKKAAKLGEMICKEMIRSYDNIIIEECRYLSDPTIKSVIVNDEVALFGLYVVKEHIKKDTNLTAFDYLGYDTRLIKVGKTRNNVSNALLEELVAWFDQEWNGPKRKIIRHSSTNS